MEEKKVLNDDELLKVSGGTKDEKNEIFEFLQEHYYTPNGTYEEYDYLLYIMGYAIVWNNKKGNTYYDYKNRVYLTHEEVMKRLSIRNGYWKGGKQG